MSIENELKKLIKKLAFLFWEIYSLVDQTVLKLIQYFNQNINIKITANTKLISEWKSKGLSDGSIKPFPTSDNSLPPLIDYYGYNIRLKFNGSILRQPKISYTHKKSVKFTSVMN